MFFFSITNSANNMGYSSIITFVKAETLFEKSYMKIAKKRSTNGTFLT